jgi:hypothetical protein
VNSFGVFETYYTSHQLAANTPSDIAWIGSFQVQTLDDGRGLTVDLLYVLRGLIRRPDLRFPWSKMVTSIRLMSFYSLFLRHS